MPADALAVAIIVALIAIGASLGWLRALAEQRRLRRRLAVYRRIVARYSPSQEA